VSVTPVPHVKLPGRLQRDLQFDRAIGLEQDGFAQCTIGLYGARAALLALPRPVAGLTSPALTSQVRSPIHVALQPVECASDDVYLVGGLAQLKATRTFDHLDLRGQERDVGPLARHTGPPRRREGLPIPQLQAVETQVR
jgi:hypothetical protein